MLLRGERKGDHAQVMQTHGKGRGMQPHKAKEGAMYTHCWTGIYVITIQAIGALRATKTENVGMIRG
jgi:hypothetical protein